MAQSGFTPILCYASGTATNVPLAANLTSSASGAELALNYADGKLYFKNSSGVVTLLASSATVAPVTTFSAGTTGFTPSTATSGAVTLAGTLATTNGGTGLTSFTANRVFYSSSTSAIGQSANLTFDGTTLTANALTTTSTVTINGGTANGVAYLNGSKVLTTGSALVYDGTILRVNGSTTSGLRLASSSGASNGFNIYNDSTTDIAYLTNFYNGSMVFGINNTEQMRLTSTGLGIGTSSPGTRLQIGNPSDSNQALRFDFTDSSTARINSTRVGSGNLQSLLLAGQDTLQFSTAGSERARIDSSGNLLVGTTSALTSASGRGNVTINGTDAVLAFGNSNSSAGYVYAASTNLEISAASTRYINFLTNGSERARITSGGDFLVGTTSAAAGSLITNNGSYHQYGNQMNYQSSSSTIEFVNRNSGGAKTFSWYYGASGGGSPATLSTSGVWTNASDARGKENIADIKYGLTTVLGLKPRQYDVKSDGSHAIGFVAQEVLPIIPELVHVTKREGDDEFYGLDYGSMTAVLVKAIQELKAEFDAYKATHP